MSDVTVRLQAPSGPAAVRVIVPAAPAVIRAVVPGPVGDTGGTGGPGPQGRPGVGPFGQITYTDRSVGIEDSFSAGVRQQLVFAPTGMTTQNLLLPPFDQHQFFVDNVLRARALGDVYGIVINLLVRSMQVGGKVRVDIDSGSPLGPLQAATTPLSEGAGVTERVSFPLTVQVLSTFMANGARFYLTADRPIQVVSETLFLLPQSVQP